MPYILMIPSKMMTKNNFYKKVPIEHTFSLFLNASSGYSL